MSTDRQKIIEKLKVSIRALSSVTNVYVTDSDDRENSNICTFHITTDPAVPVSVRTLQLCVNVFGPENTIPIERDYPELSWFVDYNDTTREYMLILYNIDSEYSYSSTIDVLVELLTIAFSIDNTDFNGYTPFPLSHIIYPYQTYTEVIEEYVLWLVMCMLDNLDRPNHSCDIKLYPSWSCCSQHIMLRVTRRQLYSWIEFFKILEIFLINPAENHF